MKILYLGSLLIANPAGCVRGRDLAREPVVLSCGRRFPASGNWVSYKE